MTRAQIAVWVGLLALTILGLPVLSYATLLDWSA